MEKEQIPSLLFNSHSKVRAGLVNLPFYKFKNKYMKSISEENLSNMLLACLITLLFLAGIFHNKKADLPNTDTEVSFYKQ